MNHPRWFVPIVAMGSATLAIIGVVLVWPGFDGLYGQDSFSYLGYALGPLDEAVRARRLPPPYFWPPGFPIMVWLASLALGASTLAGQAVSLLSGALVPVFSALLAWELFVAPRDETGGVAAPAVGAWNHGPTTDGPDDLGWLPLLVGALVVVQAQLWQSSLVVMSDAPGLAAGTAGVWLTARWGRTRRTHTLVLAAALMALAVLIRWAYALVAIPITLYALGVLGEMVRSPAGGRHRGPIAFRAPLTQAGLAALVVLLVLAPMWAPALLHGVSGDVGPEASFAGNLAVYRWSPLNAIRRTFTTTDGQLSYRFPNGLYYLLSPAHWYFFTPVLAGFLLPGAIELWRRRRADRLWLLAGWAGIVMGFHAGAAWQNFRFTVVYLPPLAVVAALGILTVGRWLGGRCTPRVFRRVRAGLAVWVALGMGAMAWHGVELIRFFMERKQADLATVRWAHSRTSADAQLLSFDLTFTLEHYGSRETSHLFYETPQTLPALVSTGRPTFVLIRAESFLAQWGEHPSGQAFRWLIEERGVREVGRDRDYVLYRVEDEN